jgi:hypothetical protein
MFLSDTRLSGDEYTQIGARYLNGYLYISVEERTLADDAKPLFDR